MELRHDALQVQLARTVRAVLGAGGDTWRTLADLDVLRLSAPVDRDGLDLGLSADIMVCTELGRALDALPGYTETVAAIALLSDATDPEPPARGDPAAVRNPAWPGEALAGALTGHHRLATAGVLTGGTLRLDERDGLHGTTAPLPRVPWAGVVALACARSTGDMLVYASLDGSAVDIESLDTLAGPSVRLHLRGAGATVLGVKDPAGTVARVRAQARVRQAAFLRGLTESALITARDRVNRREQFGRRLVDFQTVSHRLAVLAAELEGVDLLVHEAAWRCDNLSDERVDAGPAPAQSLAAAAEIATRASRLAIQLHGARGLLAGTPVERAYRLATVESLRLGTPATLWREAGRLRWHGAT